MATHIIRRSQPHMLSVLDSALAHARTLAHRIVHQDCLYVIGAGTTRATLPNYGRFSGDGPVLILNQGHANNDQMDSGSVYQPTRPHGKGAHARPPIRYDVTGCCLKKPRKSAKGPFEILKHPTNCCVYLHAIHSLAF